MNLMVQLSDTEINQAKLVSKLSGRPVHVKDDVFIWNGHLIDRATAIVALLKANNAVPVGDSIKLKMFFSYTEKFKAYDSIEDLVDLFHDRNPVDQSRIWFNAVCRIIKGTETLPNEVMKQILIDLHKN
jgi:hypothetical protein